jgi:hypothetical protein
MQNVIYFFFILLFVYLYTNYYLVETTSSRPKLLNNIIELFKAAVSDKRAFIVGVHLALFQQITGRLILLSYYFYFYYILLSQGLILSCYSFQ